MDTRSVMTQNADFSQKYSRRSGMSEMSQMSSALDQLKSERLGVPKINK